MFFILTFITQQIIKVNSIIRSISCYFKISKTAFALHHIVFLNLRVILTIERSSIQCDAKRRNFIYICAALCRERRALLKDEKNETGHHYF